MEVNASFERDHALVDREFSSRVVEVPEPFQEEISQCTNLEERIVVGVARFARICMRRMK